MGSPEPRASAQRSRVPPERLRPVRPRLAGRRPAGSPVRPTPLLRPVCPRLAWHRLTGPRPRRDPTTPHPRRDPTSRPADLRPPLYVLPTCQRAEEWSRLARYGGRPHPCCFPSPGPVWDSEQQSTSALALSSGIIGCIPCATVRSESRSPRGAAGQKQAKPERAARNRSRPRGVTSMGASAATPATGPWSRADRGRLRPRSGAHVMHM
jgi:hypothetical protein